MNFSASKPVMEGKAVLFKKFANVNSIDIEVDTKDPDELIRTVKLLEPSFGGVNLEGTVFMIFIFIVNDHIRRHYLTKFSGSSFMTSRG